MQLHFLCKKLSQKCRIMQMHESGHSSTNQVITDVGITNKYDMNNGIDQEEIISPLLWIIYYDPLFSKIKK